MTGKALARTKAEGSSVRTVVEVGGGRDPDVSPRSPDWTGSIVYVCAFLQQFLIHGRTNQSSPLMNTILRLGICFDFAGGNINRLHRTTQDCR